MSIKAETEIRPSEVTELTEKVRNLGYSKYLLSLWIERARALEDATVRFDFPVTAIVGPNGGGKTTVLGAAACAYKEISPRTFFAKSGKTDDSMANWSIEYQMVDRELRQGRDGTITRTAKFKTERWRREAPDRPVRVFGVSRTVPANERPELQKAIANNFSVAEENVLALDEATIDAVQRVLGKDVSLFSQMYIDSRGKVSLLAGATKAGQTFSEFHFGAGESSIIRMIEFIEKAPSQSLILIEEIENGLHPVAARRMVKYLVDVAKRKRIQAIFTTHSQQVVDILPDSAVWAAYEGKVQQGRLDIEAMRSIEGSVDAKLVIFVEDAFAKDWLEFCLLYFGNVAMDAVSVWRLGGSSNAVKVQQSRLRDPSLEVPSVCYIDGDAEEDPEPEQRIYKLPGSIPEQHVYDAVLDNLETVAAKLAAALHLPVPLQGQVVQVVQDVSLTNTDPHLIFAEVGARLGLITESAVRSAFIAQWAQLKPEESNAVLAPIEDLLPMNGPKAPLVPS